MNEIRTNLKILHNSYTYTTRERSSDDDWDRGDTSTDHTVNGVVIGEDHHGISVSGEIKSGDTVWLVYAVWSDGDSFGNEQNARIEFFTAHRYENQATANARILCDAEGFGADIFLDNGTQFKTSIPWNGYFESLSYVRAEPFVVGAGDVYTFLPKQRG